MYFEIGLPVSHKLLRIEHSNLQMNFYSLTIRSSSSQKIFSLSKPFSIVASCHLVILSLCHLVITFGDAYNLRSHSQFYVSCRITGVPPLQSDFYGLSSALKDDTNEPKKRSEARTKPTKMARKKSTLRMTRTTTDNYLHLLSYQHLRPAYSKVAIAGEKARRNGSAASWHSFSA